MIRALHTLAREYRAGGAECYYDVRDTRFNPLRAALQARASDPGDVADMYTPGLAAMLIFLNRTGFNGLFRLNRHGGFNVPAGRYTNPRICDEAHLRVRRRGARDPRACRSHGSRSTARSTMPAPVISSTAIRRTRR